MKYDPRFYDMTKKENQDAFKSKKGSESQLIALFYFGDNYERLWQLY